MIPLLWVTQVYPRHESDVLGRFLHLLARELPARGYSVCVVAPGADGAPDEETLDGVRIVRFPYARPGRQTLAYTGRMHREAMRNPWRFASFLRSFRHAVGGALAGETPRIVHAHWWVPAGLAASGETARRQIPFALSLHGTDLRLLAKLPLARPLARRVFRRARAVLPVSTALRDEIGRLRLGGGPPDVLPMPADADAFRPATDDEGRNGPASFVVAARLTPQKRVEVAIRAMTMLTRADPAPVLHVAGDGPERASLESLARSCGLGERVVFHGMLAPTELARIFRRARAVVVPSVGEGYGLTLVEGALCGTPGVGARSGGVTDLIEPGVTGLLFEPNDAEGLAGELDRLVADSELARELGRRARVRALPGTPGPLADRLTAVYERLTRP